MLVSIIIPTYNRADRVVEAIQSALRQTYPYKQIIVVDDGSQDKTRELVESIPDIEYFYQTNQRQAAARNSGLKLAQGNYIATLDSDDVWDEDFLTESVKCLEQNNLDFTFTNWRTRKSEEILPNVWERSDILKNYTGKPSDEWFLLDSKQLRELFIKSCLAPSSSFLIRRDCLPSGWNIDLKIADDWCLILDMVLSKPLRAAFTLRPMWTKHVHDHNIYDGQSRKKVAQELEIYDTRLLKNRYSPQLSLTEKLIFNKRILKGNLILAAYFIKHKLRIKSSLKYLTD